MSGVFDYFDTPWAAEKDRENLEKYGTCNLDVIELIESYSQKVLDEESDKLAEEKAKKLFNELKASYCDDIFKAINDASLKQKKTELTSCLIVTPGGTDITSEGIEVIKRISLTTSEAAEALGISVTMLRKLVKKGEIPYFRCGRKVLFSVDSLSEWVNSREKHIKHD